MSERNTWPKGHRHALYQGEHEEWNATNYPGTRQLCCECDEPTGRCEDDSLYLEDERGPYCWDCYRYLVEEPLETEDQP